MGSTPTGPEAAARAARSRPDVLVTQLDMQPKTAEEIISGLRKASPDSRIVVLTLWDNLRYVQAISKMDVDAMMHNSPSAEDLLATVESVTRDGSNAVVVMTRALLQRLDNASSGGLSKREIEVLVLAARGLSNRGIAEELHLAEATIKRHLAIFYGNVGIRSRNEAVRKALLEDRIGLHEITSADGDVSSDEQAG